MSYLIGITSILCFFCGPIWAASSFQRALDVKSNKYIEKGSIIGGEAGQSFSLLKVRAQTSAKKDLERIVINLGDEQGRLLKGRVSYYQVNVEQNPPRIVVDLAQVQSSKVSEQQIKAAFAKSPYIKDVKLVRDAEATSTTLVLALNRPVKAEVYNLKGKKDPGRVVIDLVQTP